MSRPVTCECCQRGFWSQNGEAYCPACVEDGKIKICVCNACGFKWRPTYPDEPCGWCSGDILLMRMTPFEREYKAVFGSPGKEPCDEF